QHLEWRRLVRRWHSVRLEAEVKALAVVQSKILVQRVPDALQDGALYLSLDADRADDPAYVLRDDVPKNRHLSGFGVDVDLRQMHVKGRRVDCWCEVPNDTPRVERRR